MDFREIVRAQLIKDEGLVDHAYQDSRGYWTIGVGRLIDAKAGGKLYPSEITFLLDNDIDEAVAAARHLIPSFDSLSDGRKAVLCNMAFNLGYIRLSGFHGMLAAVRDGRWEDAAKEMLDSTWADQVGARAVRLAREMRGYTV